MHSSGVFLVEHDRVVHTPRITATNSARSAAGRIGRPDPLSRRTDASEFTPTTSTSPSAGRSEANGRGPYGRGRNNRWSTPPPSRPHVIARPTPGDPSARNTRRVHALSPHIPLNSTSELFFGLRPSKAELVPSCEAFKLTSSQVMRCDWRNRRIDGYQLVVSPSRSQRQWPPTAPSPISDGQLHRRHAYRCVHGDEKIEVHHECRGVHRPGPVRAPRSITFIPVTDASVRCSVPAPFWMLHSRTPGTRRPAGRSG